MRYLIVICVIFLAAYTRAQKIEIDWVEVSGNKVIVHYNLEDANSNHQYLINLFTSQDNFTTALTKVTGDVGQEVKPGGDRKIYWDITKELGLFKGKLTFEVRGRVFVPFVKLTEFEEGKIFKRGKNAQLNWTSGNTGGQVNIELFKGQQRFQVENNVPNSGRYDWHIPGGQKKGTDYRLRFTNTKDRNDYVESKIFSIKPKVPMAIKMAAIVVVGAGLKFSGLFDKKPEGTSAPIVDDEVLANYPGKP